MRRVLDKHDESNDPTDSAEVPQVPKPMSKRSFDKKLRDKTDATVKGMEEGFNRGSGEKANLANRRGVSDMVERNLRRKIRNGEET